MPRTIILIDGDQYLYRACAATEHETKWDEENHVLASNEVEAWDTVSSSLKKVIDHFGSKDYVLTFSEGEVFRKQIDPTYKGNRAGTRKPLCYYDVRERLIAAHKSIMFNGLEADDVMGILATKPGPDSKIIVARDKDMKTIPGKLWDGSKFLTITEYEANYWHLYQTLVGDTADGYKGCPGIGPKKAEQALCELNPNSDAFNANCKVGWEVIKILYANAGLTEEDALKQARLARILRWSDWDSIKKEPILWSPG